MMHNSLHHLVERSSLIFITFSAIRHQQSFHIPIRFVWVYSCDENVQYSTRMAFIAEHLDLSQCLFLIYIHE